MQSRLRSTISRLSAVLVAVSALAFAACGDDDESPGQERDINGTIQLNAAAAANHSTELLNGYTFTDIAGSTLASAASGATQLAGKTVSISFSNISGANGSFSMNASGTTASGTVVFASCKFTVTISSNPTVIPVGTIITITNCSVTIDADNVPVGGSQGTPAHLTLNMNSEESDEVDASVLIRNDGFVVVINGTGIQVVTTLNTTGSTGG